MKQKSSRYVCPTCGKDAEVCVAAWFGDARSFRRLDLPYFICTTCRHIYYNKTETRKAIKEWRAEAAFLRQASLCELARPIIAFLDGLVSERIKHFGYTSRKFIKK